MTARLGTIKEDVRIELPRPRTFDVLSTREFFDHKSRLLSSVREESLMAAGFAA